MTSVSNSTYSLFGEAVAQNASYARASHRQLFAHASASNDVTMVLPMTSIKSIYMYFVEGHSPLRYHPQANRPLRDRRRDDVWPFIGLLRGHLGTLSTENAFYFANR